MTTTKTSPLPLSAEMSAAWHKGLKTESRRPIKPQPPVDDLYFRTRADGSVCVWAALNSGETYQASPRHQPGDIVWIREPGRSGGYLAHDRRIDVQYLADNEWADLEFPRRLLKDCKPPLWATCCNGIPHGIFKEACRAWGKALTVRVERVQDITEESARAEGVKPHCGNTIEDCALDYCRCDLECPEPETYRAGFRITWDSIYASRGLGWGANPWVWGYKLEPCDKPEGWE